MRTFPRHALSLALPFLLSALGQAQTQPPNSTTGTSSISGALTTGGKPVPGAIVALQTAQMLPTGPNVVARATSDPEGRYQFAGIAAGSYIVIPLTPALTAQSDSSMGPPGRAVTLSEGENVRDVNINLVRGGVITGKVVDPDGRPMIAQYLQATKVTERAGAFSWSFLTNRSAYETDDRGVYRLYGIPAGRYRVSMGEPTGMPSVNSGRGSYPRTFHPDTTDESKATIVEVSEGSEATGVDIRLSLPTATYTISGRALDAETGQPAPGISIGYAMLRGDGGGFTSLGAAGPSAPNGEFSFESAAGRYLVFASAEINSESYSDPVTIDVNGVDVAGVEIKVKRGATITGVAVIEGTNDPGVLSRLSQLQFAATVRSEGPTPPHVSTISIGTDGRFRLVGLRAGKVIVIQMGLPPTDLVLTRIERDGVRQANGIDVGTGEQISGVRLVITYATGSIHGQVLIKGAALPDGAYFSVMARRADSYQGLSDTRTDSRGNFIIERLTPGQYEVTVEPHFSGPPPPEFQRSGGTARVRQTAVVANGQQTQITFTLDLSQGRRQ